MVKLSELVSRTILRYFIWGLIAGLLAIATYYVWNTPDVQSPVNIRQQEDEDPLVLSNPEMREFKKDILKFHLIAESAQIFEQDKIMTLIQIKAELFESDNTLSIAKIKADFGEMDNKSGLLHLWGAVRVDTKDGQHLLTQELFVNRLQNILYNDVAVTAISGNDIIEATSMQYHISKGVLLLRTPQAKFEI